MMKKHFLLLFFLLSVFGFASQAQTEDYAKLRAELKTSNPNYEHDRITYMWLESQNEPVSHEAYVMLQNNAQRLNIPQAQMMRNQFIFRVLENKKISLADRIWAADLFLRADDISYPKEYIQTVKSNLLLQVK